MAMGKGASEAKRTAWRKRLTRFARSGEKVAAFCAAERVSVQTFYRWKRTLASESRRRERRQPSKPLPACREARFLPVDIAGAAEVKIELPNGAQVRVPASDLGAVGAAVAAAGRVPRQAEEETPRC
jgi:hypothetical protein